MRFLATVLLPILVCSTLLARGMGTPDIEDGEPLRNVLMCEPVSDSQNLEVARAIRVVLEEWGTLVSVSQLDRGGIVGPVIGEVAVAPGARVRSLEWGEEGVWILFSIEARGLEKPWAIMFWGFKDEGMIDPVFYSVQVEGLGVIKRVGVGSTQENIEVWIQRRTRDRDSGFWFERGMIEQEHLTRLADDFWMPDGELEQVPEEPRVFDVRGPQGQVPE